MLPVAWRVCFLLDILRETQEIERELGRMKKSAGGNYSDRLIDIDILFVRRFNTAYAGIGNPSSPDD